MRPVQHIVNVSGGKDSGVCYLLALRRGLKFRAIMADTENESELTYRWVEELPGKTGGPLVEIVKADFSVAMERKRNFIAAKWPDDLEVGKVGKWFFTPSKALVASGAVIIVPPAPDLRMPVYGGTPFKVDVDGGYWKWRAGRAPMPRAAAQEIADIAIATLRPTGNAYLDLCMMKGRFPSRMAQFCTEELKTLPIVLNIILPALRNGTVLQWLGIRSEESPSRAKDPRFNRHESGCYLYRPIKHWTREQVFAFFKECGLDPNPLYGMGFSRVGCFPCINSQKGEVRLLADLYPAHIARIRQWENLVSLCAKRGISTFFPAMTDPTDANDQTAYSHIDRIVDWSRTARGGRQYGIFFEAQTGGGCDSDLALCEQ